LEYDSKPVKYYSCCRGLTYDVELITKDLGTWGKTVWTHTTFVISSWGFECIMKVGTYNVDGVLGADQKVL